MRSAHRSVEIDGYGTFELPAYLVRIDTGSGPGWQARPPGKKTRWFADGVHGDPIASFSAAQAFLRKIGTPESVSPLRSREFASKQIPTGVVGVYVQFKQRKGRRVREVQLLIPRPSKDGPARVLYVGTELNYEARLDAKVAEAAAIRDRFEQEWRHKADDARLARVRSGRERRTTSP